MDMLIEEVSLVDKAANKLTFLVIKRDAPKDEPKNDETVDKILEDLKACKELLK